MKYQKMKPWMPKVFVIWLAITLVLFNSTAQVFDQEVVERISKSVAAESERQAPLPVTVTTDPDCQAGAGWSWKDTYYEFKVDPCFVREFGPVTIEAWGPKGLNFGGVFTPEPGVLYTLGDIGMSPTDFFCSVKIFHKWSYVGDGRLIETEVDRYASTFPKPNNRVCAGYGFTEKFIEEAKKTEGDKKDQTTNTSDNRGDEIKNEKIQ